MEHSLDIVIQISLFKTKKVYVKHESGLLRLDVGLPDQRLQICFFKHV